MKFTRIRSQALACCLGLLPAMASQAGPLDISEVPITVGASPAPNVMLLLDSSASMKNLNWPDGFDPTKLYTKWCGVNCSADDRWYYDDDYVPISTINKDEGYDKATIGAKTHTCTAPSGASGGVPVMGVNSTATIIRCLYLPGDKNTVLTGNYLNYLLETYGTDIVIANTTSTSHTSANLADGTIPTTRRVDTVKSIVRDHIIPIDKVNFGLAQFAGSDGADIIASCGNVDKNNIGTYLTSYQASGGTPLSEALYEITRYFRGMSHFYGEGNEKNLDYTSPIAYPCQSNFTIVLTDGLPTRIDKWPAKASDDPNLCNAGSDPTKVTCNGTAPDWDGKHPTEPDAYPPFAQFSDGHKQNVSAPGKYIFTDDIAKFAYDIDLKTGAGFDDKPFIKQNMRTITVGFGLDAQVLKDAAYYGNGSIDESLYYNAKTSTALQTALVQALDEIKTISQVSSSSSVAASAGYVSDSTALYQGQFEFIKDTDSSFGENTWTGHLKQYPIDSTNGDVASTPDLDAAAVLDSAPAADRNIFSYNPVTRKGGKFDTSTDGLTTDQIATLGNKFVIDYIRGVRNCEAQNDPASDPACKDADNNVYSFRNRQSVLGTIVNSSPLAIPKPSSIYPDNWGDGAPENTNCTSEDITGCYSTFKENNKSRHNIIYVGANDGMLHAFDGGYPGTLGDPDDPPVTATLKEKFAYVPNTVLAKLSSYGDPSHMHKFYVDGTPTVIDAYNASTNEWRTILVGSLGKGGQGIFALDVTEIGNGTTTLAATDVLWEFTDADHADLGYTFSRPAIIRMHNGKWAAVFGNGYNNTEADGHASTSGNAALYFVDLFTGKLITTIDTHTGLDDDPTNNSDPFTALDSRPNGLSSVAPVDLNNDMIADYIYAGDIYGNLWRFDVTSATPADWSIYGKGEGNITDPIFVASYTGETSNTQSITSRPEVARAGAFGIMLYFGTGRYLGLDDNLDTTNVQSFYGLLDDPEGDHAGTSTRVTRAGMTRQTFGEETVEFAGTNQTVRQFSNYATVRYKSWYIDLIDGTATGERVISTPLVRGVGDQKRVIFVSIIPSAESCTGGGRSWLIELNAGNGNRTPEPVFDLNYDGKLSGLDNGTGDKVYNGWSQSGIQSTPAIIISEGKEHKYMSSSSGGIVHVTEALPKVNKGRQSWRQLK